MVLKKTSCLRTDIINAFTKNMACSGRLDLDYIPAHDSRCGLVKIIDTPSGLDNLCQLTVEIADKI